MKKHSVLIILSGLLVIAGLFWGIKGSISKSGENVVVRYRGGQLTLEDLNAHYHKMKKDPRFRKNPEQVTREFALEHAVNMEMIIAEGLKRNLHLDPRIRAEIHGFMADLFLRVMQDSLIPEIDKNTFSDEDVRAYFDAHPASYQSPVLFDVGIIKSADRTEQERILAGIFDGKFTFEEAARRFSTDSDTGEKGGALGKRPLKSFRREWQDVIGGLETGSISTPINFGEDWYLFKLAGKTEPAPYRFEDKKAYVRNDLLYSRYREAWQKAYDQLRKDHSLEMDETLIRTFCKGNQSS